MNKEQLYELFGDIEEKNIKDAEQPIVKKKNIIWIKIFVPLTACFILVLGIGLIQINKNNTPSDPSTSEEYLAVEHKNINVYYISNNEIVAISEYLICSPEEVFKAWKTANNIGEEVELIKVEITSNGIENVISGENSSTASYNVGDYFSMEVTVTENLKNYYSIFQEDMLLESLKLTLTEYGYVEIDNYTIIFG